MVMDPLMLQLHTTNRCNQRCKHCYHDSYVGDELSLKELKKVVFDFVALAEKNKKIPRIGITGGEPFVRRDFLDLLRNVASYGSRLESVYVLTNGSLLTQAILDEIKLIKIDILAFQISLEGDYETNDGIRGKGSFVKIFKAIALLKKNGFPIKLSATFSKRNYKKISSLSVLLKKYSTPVALRRFVPIGGVKTDVDQMLSPLELQLFYHKMQRINEKYRKIIGFDLFTFLNHCASSMLALDWPEEIMHHCDVKEQGIITIMPNGDFYPCRVLPLKIGNLRKKSLEKIFEEDYVNFLKNDRIDIGCFNCSVYAKCKSGAMCMGHAVSGDMFAKDPQCWYA